MNIIHRLLVCGMSALILTPAHRLAADAATQGPLFIVGGGLRANNDAVYKRMIDSAGGREKARFVVFPTASQTEQPALEAAEVFINYGVPRDHIRVIDLTLENADRQAFSIEVTELIRSSTGAFFAGGDQFRITRALLKPDGSPTPVLAALQNMWRSGGVIAGTSAGAAVQSETMICAAGLPDECLDEGMDALDFGVRRKPRQRGLLVSNGLGFFRDGIIDQHFSQYRGRLGRLARVLIEEKKRFGFGIDENTALIVGGDGRLEVLGYGNVIVVDASDGKLDDGPLGCRISGIRVSLLQTGDGFDPARGQMLVRSEKKPIVEGTQDSHGTYFLADMAGPGAIPWAITLGLADNSSRKQAGIALKYNQQFAHGYELTLAKAPRTVCYGGYVEHRYSYAVDSLELELHPVVAVRQDPRVSLPIDLPTNATRTAVEAAWFRGILLQDEQRRIRPTEPITRLDFANAVATSVHLPLPPKQTAVGCDALSDEAKEDLSKVVAVGLLDLRFDKQSHLTDSISRLDAARSLVRLASLLDFDGDKSNSVSPRDLSAISEVDRPIVMAAVRQGLLRLDERGRFQAAAFLKREELATALFKIFSFPWSLAPTN